MGNAERDDTAERLERVKTAYDSLASSYDRRWRHYIDVSLSKVIAVLSFRNDEHVLDLACGTGELEGLMLVRWPRLKITAVDLSQEMLARAQEKPFSREINWIEADCSRLPVPDGSIDVAICANSFHYFPKPMACLREIRRCLVPSGRLVLVDWCDDYWTCKMCAAWLRLTDPAFSGMYTMRDCHRMLTASGLDVVRSERFKVGWLWGMMLFFCQRSVG